jgi:hypothetical protein
VVKKKKKLEELTNKNLKTKCSQDGGKKAEFNRLEISRDKYTALFLTPFF